MMRSMFSAVSGLRVHQTKMDVIGNNIANVNTIGYKSQRVTFTDVFSQTLSSASSASDETGRGGTNPTQVGLGVNVSSIDILMTQGAAQRTDNPFDLMINGEGFIVVGDTNNTYFTRAGALRADEKGNLTTSNGMIVKGWKSQLNEETNQYEIIKGEVTNINLADPNFVSSIPKVTDKVQLSGNLDSTSTKEETTLRFYDSLGNYYSLAATFTPSEETVEGYSVWDMNLGTIKDKEGNQLNSEVTPNVAVKLYFDTNGKLASINQTPAATNNPKSIDLKVINSDKTSTFAEAITIDVSSMTQYVSDSTIESKTMNGNSAGKMIGYEIGTNGIITVSYDNGDMRTLAQVVVAKFDNPEGLEKVGDNLYKITPNSGEFDGVGTAGTFNTGVLEMSNVDLSGEFTDMIVTQRGFQANSRIISVSDEMLQELTNLKR